MTTRTELLERIDDNTRMVRALMAAAEVVHDEITTLAADIDTVGYGEDAEVLAGTVAVFDAMHDTADLIRDLY